MFKELTGALFGAVLTYSAAADTITVPVKQFGYGAFSSNIAVSPDGRTFAAGASDGTTRLWDIATERVIRTFPGHTDSVLSVTFSLDGSKIMTGSTLRDSTARFFDVASGASLNTLTNIRDARKIVFTPDSVNVLIGTSDNQIKLWNSTSGTYHDAISVLSSNHNVFAISPDGNTLVTIDRKNIRLIDLLSMSIIKTFSPESSIRENATCVDFSSDGTSVVAGFGDPKAVVWDTASGASIILSGHSQAITSVAFSHDGSKVLTASKDLTAKLWDITSGTCLQTFSGHTGTVTSAIFSPDSTNILTGSKADNSIKLWDISSGICLKTFCGHTRNSRSVAFSPDSKTMLMATDDNRVLQWDIASGACLKEFSGHTFMVYSVAWSPDGLKMVSGSHDQTAKVWDIESGVCLKTFEPSIGASPVISVAFCPDNRKVLTVQRDNLYARLWDMDSDTCIQEFYNSDGFTTCAFSPDSMLFATGSSRGRVRLWSTRTGSVLSTFETSSLDVHAIAFSQDGTMLVTGSNRTVELWDLDSGTCLKTFEAHSVAITSIAFSPDGTKILTGSRDNTAKIFDTSAVCIKTFVPSPPLRQISEINSVSFSHDGNYILTGSLDHTARLWVLDETSTHMVSIPKRISTAKLGLIPVSNTSFRLIGGHSLNKANLLIVLPNGRTIARLQVNTFSSEPVILSTPLASGIYLYQITSLGVDGAKCTGHFVLQ